MTSKDIQIDAVHTDIRRVFVNAVELFILIKKLKYNGLAGHMFGWLNSYLIGRTQFVK